jgi:hypothetical protein
MDFCFAEPRWGRLQERLQFTIKRATSSIHPGVALRARHVGKLSPRGGSAVEKSVSTRSASSRPSYKRTTYRAVSAEIICHRGAPHNYRTCKVHVFELLIHPLNAEGKTISLLFQGTVCLVDKLVAPWTDYIGPLHASGTESAIPG